MNEIEDKHFKILCIDGGGIKGLFSARVLDVFEQYFDTICSDHFDLICGTSTGGIIALGASLKIPMKDIAAFYETKGPIILSSCFQKMGKIGDILLALKQAIVKSKYRSKRLEESLQEVFGNRIIGESNNLLCIPAYNLTEGKPRVFKKDYDTFRADDQKLYVDVAMATSAAPTYFPIKEINDTFYVDGGVFANNPVILGITEYLYKWAHEGYSGVDILSVSSCQKALGESPCKLNRSFMGWKDSLFNCFSNGQLMITDIFIQKLADSKILPFELNIVRVSNKPVSGSQEKLVAMDNASNESLRFFNSKAKDLANEFTQKPEIRKFFQEKKTVNP